MSVSSFHYTSQPVIDEEYYAASIDEEIYQHDDESVDPSVNRSIHDDDINMLDEETVVPSIIQSTNQPINPVDNDATDITPAQTSADEPDKQPAEQVTKQVDKQPIKTDAESSTKPSSKPSTNKSTNGSTRSTSSKSVKKTIYFVRHAESEYNAFKLNPINWLTLAALSDPHFYDARLSNQGINQLINLSKVVERNQLRDRLELIVCSPLRRAIDTALAVEGPEFNVGLIKQSLKKSNDQTSKSSSKQSNNPLGSILAGLKPSSSQPTKQTEKQPIKQSNKPSNGKSDKSSDTKAQINSDQTNTESASQSLNETINQSDDHSKDQSNNSSEIQSQNHPIEPSVDQLASQQVDAALTDVAEQIAIERITELDYAIDQPIIQTSLESLDHPIIQSTIEPIDATSNKPKADDQAADETHSDQTSDQPVIHSNDEPTNQSNELLNISSTSASEVDSHSVEQSNDHLSDPSSEQSIDQSANQPVIAAEPLLSSNAPDQSAVKTTVDQPIAKPVKLSTDKPADKKSSKPVADKPATKTNKQSSNPLSKPAKALFGSVMNLLPHKKNDNQSNSQTKPSSKQPTKESTKPTSESTKKPAPKAADKPTKTSTSESSKPTSDQSITQSIKPVTDSVNQSTNQAIKPYPVPIVISPLCTEIMDTTADVGSSPSELRSAYQSINFDHLDEIWWYHEEKSTNAKQSPKKSNKVAQSIDKMVTAEPPHVIQARVRNFLGMLAERSENVIAVVTHSSFIKHCTKAKFKIDNCAVQECELFKNAKTGEWELAIKTEKLK